MSDLFAPHPTDNLLPYDGELYDLGQLDVESLTKSVNNDQDVYQALLNALSWQADIVTLFGKTHITKRQVVWMGDTGLSYRYAGHTHKANGWHPLVLSVKQLIESRIHELNISDKHPSFNACLLNYYPSGKDGMGYHADDEKELGDKPLIAALSLGATRKFVFKHKKTQDKVELYLESGQLIVMHGVTQRFWRHTITKTTKVNEGRISLTFRQMLSA